MIRTDRKIAFLRHAVTGVVAISLLAGCAGTGQFARAIGAASKAEAKSGKSSRALSKAEKAVIRNPQNPALRSALAHAYLDAGRFDSATAAFTDAMTLGDASPRTALSLALSHIGAGRSREAIALLDQWRDSLPAGDLGLALALAGDTTRGVAILSDALRAGDNSPKLRQNLAYAYALDGRWSEARVMAAQDVPANELDARISNWAMLGKPEDYQRRVAALLGVRVSADPGQPAQLALASPAGNVVAATAAPQVALAQTYPATELPALDGTPAEQPAPAPAPVAPAWVAPVAANEAEYIPEPQPLVAAAAPEPFASAFPAQEPGYVAQALVQPVPAAPVAVPIQKSAYINDRPAPRAPQRQAAKAVRVSGASTHLVQLGSFSSEANARRAWDIYRARHPELREHEMTITPAMVRGRKFWRVAAAGFDARSATGMCSSVKGRGGACIAYASTRPLPGALPATGSGGAMRARR